jgi:hypothetical protein
MVISKQAQNPKFKPQYFQICKKRKKERTIPESLPFLHVRMQRKAPSTGQEENPHQKHHGLFQPPELGGNK